MKMKQKAAEQEKASFLNAADSKAPDKNSTKDRQVEVKYDLSKNYKKKSTKSPKLIFLTVCDYLLVLTVVAVNVVGFWRGLFGIFSQFQDLYHLFFLYLLGCTIVFHFTVARKAYKKNLKGYSMYGSVLRKGYTYVFGCACVAQWAGLWYFLDEMSGLEVYPPLAYSVICSVILMCIKLYRNVLAVPVTFCTDHLDEFFEFPTVFNTNPSEQGSSDTSLYVLDCFFSVFVIGGLVVFVWRGVWCLIDIFLYPENEKYSAFGSLAIGYGIVIIVFSMQLPMENLCEKLTGFWRLLVADIYVFFSFIGTINLWRGIWNLLNIYFLPESPILSCWITHLGSFALLVLINCSNSTLVRGVNLDGEGGGKCVAFPVSYLRVIFKKHLNKESANSEMNEKKSSLRNACEDVEKGQRENSENGKSCIRSSDSSPGS